jgi:hypothetical protein
MKFLARVVLVVLLVVLPVVAGVLVANTQRSGPLYTHYYSEKIAFRTEDDYLSALFVILDAGPESLTVTELSTPRGVQAFKYVRLEVRTRGSDPALPYALERTGGATGAGFGILLFISLAALILGAGQRLWGKRWFYSKTITAEDKE